MQILPFPQGWVRRVLAASLGMIPLLGLPAQAAEHTLDVGAGFQTNFDSDHRAVYGGGHAFSLGYRGTISPKDSRILVEVGYFSASGKEFFSDPTFEQPEARYWVLPIVIGVQTNFVPAKYRKSVSLYGGIGFSSAFSQFKDPNGDTSNIPVFGLMVELRPEVQLSNALAIWVGQRVSVTTTADYGPGLRDFNFSGATLQLGLSYGVH